MAHKGRHYPLHFRRDFNYETDVRSHTAFAKAYDITLHSGVVPPYLVDGEQFHCIEIDGPDDATLQWLSPARTIGVWSWQLRLLVSYIDLPSTLQRALWKLERDAILVAAWIRAPSSFTDPINAGSPFLGATLFNDFTTFERGSAFYFSTTNATGYPP